LQGHLERWAIPQQIELLEINETNLVKRANVALVG
jgi:hypothetical protein